MVVEALSFLYTLGPRSDEQMVALYRIYCEDRRWPEVDPETVRKRCSDARRLDKRLQKVGTTKSSHGKTVGVYGFTAVAA